MIIVLKFQKDQSSRTKAIPWKPMSQQTTITKMTRTDPQYNMPDTNVSTDNHNKDDKDRPTI
jgi:hypothetical protein